MVFRWKFREASCLGLLGPNGAGKTTAIRTILNIIAPDSGTITFDDKPFTPAMWNVIGYLPEERVVPEEQNPQYDSVLRLAQRNAGRRSEGGCH